MDVDVILTYRCNSRCAMCNIWKHPTMPDEEVPLEALDKIPYGIEYMNMTGGEPTLRADLAEIVDMLHPRARTFEISSNGLRPEKIYPIIKKYPDIKIRFSLEGFEETSNQIRGEKNGFQTKMDGLLKLQELGGKDLGFAVTIQDENADQLVRLFEIAEKHGFEMATSTLHNGFQFHKTDNGLYDRLRASRHIEDLITAQLKTFNVKNWFRAYLNLGLAARALGHPRLLACTAASNFVFIDPWSDVYACNVRPDLKIGNLLTQSWDEVINGEKIQEVRQKVAQCKQNCWMVGSAKTAMRIQNPRFGFLPRPNVLFWVMENKLKVTLGGKIDFDRYIDHQLPPNGQVVNRREYYGDKVVERKVQHKEDVHYTNLGNFENH